MRKKKNIRAERTDVAVFRLKRDFLHMPDFTRQLHRSGAGLKNYSVVVGSFSLKANAEGLQGTLKSAGYDAQIVYNPSNNFYRVVAATFDLKSDAVSSRDQFRSKYPDAWLLFKK